MKTMSVGEAQKQLAELVGALKDGPVLLHRKGLPCAALVGLDEPFDHEAFSLEGNGRDRQPSSCDPGARALFFKRPT